jgi:long-chain acyl-CoA synthetase
LNFIDLLGNYSLKELEKIDAKKDIAAILFTAGTTGQPKGVMLTHYNLVVNALQSYYWLRGWGYVSKPQVLGWPVVLCAVPFFHSYGMVVMNEAIQFGCTLVLVPKPTSEDMLKSIMDYKVTHFPTIPRFVKEILNHEKLEKYDLSSLSHCASGGSSISLEHIKAFESLSGARFYQGYGLTEAGPSTHATPVEGEPKHGSVGFAYPDTEVKIVDLKIGEVEIPEGRIGEIIVKGPQVMKGYWKDPEATKNVLRNGWLYTGDVGYLDSDGFLYVVGRKRDRILARGHAVYPNTVEEVIQSHPFVDTAIAVGVTDPLRCSTNVIGIVVLKKKASISEEALIKYCAETLEPYQVPSEIEFFEKLPMSPIGKVDRYLVEKMVTEKIVKYANGFKENSGS